jgi:hypothetical protein
MDFSKLTSSRRTCSTSSCCGTGRCASGRRCCRSHTFEEHVKKTKGLYTFITRYVKNSLVVVEVVLVVATAIESENAKVIPLNVT